MTWSRQQIDSWQADTHRRLTQTVAAVLDLIDVGPTADEDTLVVAGRAVSGRRPSVLEQDATYRGGDAYQPTEFVRRAEFYVSPEARTVAWEGQVQQAVTGVFAAISVAVEQVGLLRLAPADEYGRTLPAPSEPPTREVVSSRTASVRWVVDIDPAGCRRHVLSAAAYLGAVVDQVADRLRATTGEEVGEFVGDQAALLGGTVRSLAGRLRDRRPDLDRLAPGARWCGCADPGCERVTWPGDGAVHATCRKRAERGRQAC